MVWIDETGDRPAVLRPGFQSKKRLFALLFNHAGLLMVDIKPEKTTMASRQYTGTVLLEDSNDQPPLIHRNSTARRQQ